MKNTIFTILVSVLCVAFLEAGLRIKNLDMRNYDIEMWKYSNRLKFLSDDPVLGHEHKKNAKAVFAVNKN